MKAKVFIVIFLIVSVLPYASADERMKGNGKLEKVVLEIEDFNVIRVDAIIDLVYEQSEEKPTLEVTIDENLHPYVKAEIKNRTLHLGFMGAKVDSFTKFIVKVNSQWLREVRLDDNAGFQISSPLKGDEFKVKAGASALVNLKNPIEVGKLIIDATSSSNVIIENAKVHEIESSAGMKASVYLKGGSAKIGAYSSVTGGEIFGLGFEVPVLSCNITGNGLIEAYCSNALKINILGKGKVRYKGARTVETSKMLGTVEKIEETEEEAPKEEKRTDGVVPASEFIR